VYGYADPEVVLQRPYRAVHDYIIDLVSQAPVFVLKDLVVCDDEKVEFSGFSTVRFNNVIIEGSGEIVLGNNTKMHAYQVKKV
jgi:hypothetical protein